MYHKIIIVLTFFTIFFSPSKGLECYVCTMSGSESSDLCVTSPSAISGSSTMECNLRYCTIRRQEYKNPQGRIASFHRGCENNPVHLNTMVDSDDFRTYYRACTSDLCNTGNGIQLVNSNTGSGSNLITLLVQGTGRSSTNINLPHLAIMSITFIFTIFMNYVN